MSIPTTPAPASKRTLEHIDAEIRGLQTELSTADPAQNFQILQKLMAVTRERATLTSSEDLVILKEKRAELTRIGNDVQTIVAKLLAGGVPPEQLGLEPAKRKKASGEGQVTSAINYTEKHSVLPLGRLLASLIRTAGEGGISEQDLNSGLTMAGMKSIHDSGSAGASLRGLRDIYHVISFEGSPGGSVAENTIRVYRWVATEEQMATYNEALKKAGKEVIA